jgi:hypothetical protein
MNESSYMSKKVKSDTDTFQLNMMANMNQVDRSPNKKSTDNSIKDLKLSPLRRSNILNINGKLDSVRLQQTNSGSSVSNITSINSPTRKRNYIR